MDLTAQQAYTLLYDTNLNYRDFEATLKTKNRDEEEAYPGGESWNFLYYNFKSLVEAGYQRHRSEEQARMWAVIGFQKYLKKRIKISEAVMSEIHEVKISRIHPFYINLTRWLPVDQRRYNPTELLEIGPSIQDVEELLLKLYDEELVAQIMGRLNSEPDLGAGNVWKIWLSQHSNGKWMVHVTISNLAELTEFIQLRSPKKKKRTL